MSTFITNPNKKNVRIFSRMFSNYSKQFPRPLLQHLSFKNQDPNLTHQLKQKISKSNQTSSHPQESQSKPT